MPPSPSGFIEYKECFRSVDGKLVLYSTTGDSTDIKGFFPGKYSYAPWTYKTTLYFGYHGGLLRRADAD